MKGYGINLYSLRNSIKTEPELLETAIKLREMGYSFLQFSGTAFDADMIKRVSDESGLPFVLTHVPMDRIIGDTEALMEEHARFGCKNIGLGAMGSKIIMDALPNIHLLGMFIMVYTLVYRVKALIPIYLFIFMTGLYGGFGLWWLPYLYIWAILALPAWLIRKAESPLVWAMLSGIFGLFFGLLCAPVYLFSGGIGFAVSWWVQGIPYDLLHCAGNFVMALILFVPLRKLLNKLYTQMKW